MYSRKVQARCKPIAPAAPESSVLNEGDWRSTIVALRGEIQRLSEENDVLKSATAELSIMWKKVAEKLNLLTSENQCFQNFYLDMLEEERQRDMSVTMEKGELLHRLKDAQEKYTSGDMKERRFAELLEMARKGGAFLLLHRRVLAEKEVQFQEELELREKRLPETQQELEEELKRVKAELAVKDNLLVTQRNQWEMQKKAYEDERSWLLQLLGDGGRTCSPQSPPYPATREFSNFSKQQHSPVSLPLHRVAEDGPEHLVSKKSRLEKARQQRRSHEKQQDETTLTSLIRLNDLRENIHL